MTPTWTTAPPTAEGWYWWRYASHSPSVVWVQLNDDDNELWVDQPDMWVRPAELGGQWSGPLAPPAEESAP